MEYYIIAVVTILIGALIGERKGRAGAGAFFSFLPGPFGWLLILAGPELRQNTASEDHLQRKTNTV